jgi:hypothetical protein
VLGEMHLILIGLGNFFNSELWIGTWMVKKKIYNNFFFVIFYYFFSKKGPFRDFSAVTIYHPQNSSFDSSSKYGHAFANIGFVGKNKKYQNHQKLN